MYVGDQRRQLGLDHPRAGDIVAVAAPGCWFAHDYWPAGDTAAQPDFTHAVEIHKKPGYDPRELRFRSGGKLRAAYALARKKIGMRYVMNAITTDTATVRGSAWPRSDKHRRGPAANQPTGHRRESTNCDDKHG